MYMFNGIVTLIGRVEDIQHDGDTDVIALIGVQSEEFLSQIVIGSSIACSGVCLSVVEKGATHFVTNISKATLDITNLRFWTLGTKVNLEPALRAGAPLDGHMVQGHVDCIGEIHSITQVAGSHVMEICCDSSTSKYIAKKSSIALDGVSLTVNSTTPGLFSVNLIPYTWNNTTFQYNTVGDFVNIETDLIARYLEALLAYRTYGL
ncbi:riboflavin synthase [Anaplasma phagocytophilum]|uniref:riboflavin synthase n=1 Tax=Anaplasma phagocytophilum TaxID=948 RepID=UPI003D96C62A